MNNSNLPGRLLLPIAEEQSPIRAWLRERINTASGQDELLDELSQIFQIVNFQLGDLISSPSDLSDPQNQKEFNSQLLYVICEGRVLLQGFGLSGEQQVPIQFLKDGETFGGDFYYCQASSSYQAIAASQVKIAKVSLNKFRPWLDKFPELQRHWLIAAQNRQRLVFFKSLSSALRNLPTHKLHKFLSYLEEKTIAPGEYLAQVNPQAGRFWLRQGKIQNQTSDPGFAWGYPEPIPVDWVSQTELLTYHLPKADWETAMAISPILASALGASIQSQLTRESCNYNKDTAPAFPQQQTPPNSHSMVRNEPRLPQVSMSPSRATEPAPTSSSLSPQNSSNDINTNADVVDWSSSLQNLLDQPPVKLDPGLAWVYPEPIPVDGVSQTELLTDHLPKADWETAMAISPILASALGASTQSQRTRESRNGNKDTTPAFPQQQTPPNSHSVVRNESRLPQVSMSPSGDLSQKDNSHQSKVLHRSTAEPAPTSSSLTPQNSAKTIKINAELVDWSPSLQNLLDQPPVTLPKRMIFSGIVFFLAFVAWSWFGEIEELGKAQGKLIPKGETYKVESIELGKISHIAVQEGEEVTAGQLLAQLDTTLAFQEVERLEQILTAAKIELSQKQAQLERVDLEVQTHERISAAETLGQRLAINSAQNKAQVLRQLLAQQKAEIEAYQTRQELLTSVPKISQERFEQVNSELAAHQERLARLKKLARSGAVSQEFIFQAEQAQRQAQLQLLDNKAQEITNVSEQLFQAEQSLRDLQEQKTQSQGELASALKEVEQLEADLMRQQAERSRMMLEAEQKIQQLKLEVTQIETKIAETQNLLASAQAKLQEKSLKSPIDGVVLSLNVKNSGKVFNPGETIAEIAPRESPLVLSAVMANQESGFIEIGMPVQVKLDAYSYQDFGTIPGKILSISSDAKPDETLGLVYQVEIELEQDYIVKEQKSIPFKPGQTATAEIILRRRRLLDIFLDPVKQIQKDGIDL